MLARRGLLGARRAVLSRRACTAVDAERPRHLDAAAIESSVNQLAAEHALDGTSSDAPLGDLAVKCKVGEARTSARARRVFTRCAAVAQVLSACELKFGVAVPHADLNRIGTLAELISYFQERARRTERELLEAEQHWTRQLPPNVKLDLEGKVSLTKPPAEADDVPSAEPAEAPSADDEQDASGAEPAAEAGAASSAGPQEGARAAPQ